MRPAVLVPLALLSCMADDLTVTREEAERNPERVVVARVGDHRYTLADVLTALSQRGDFAQERYQAPQAKRVFLEAFVDYEVLVTEAIARGWHRAPDATRALKAALAAALWERGQLPGADRAALTEERLREYHARYRERFLEPERARVVQILVSLPTGKPLEARARARARAKEVRAELGDRPDAARFAEVARRRSDDAASRDRGGDVGFVARGFETEEIPRELAEAVFGVPAGGSGEVESGLGVHIFRVEARVPGRPAAFEAVRKPVEAALWKEMRREGMKRLVAELKAKAKVEVDVGQMRALGEKSEWVR